MNIVSKNFTKEQYKALYEAQQLGVRFDCYLLAPGERAWKGDLPLVDERALQPKPNFGVDELLLNINNKIRLDMIG